MLAALAESKGEYKKARDNYNKILDIYKSDPGIGTESARYAYIMAKSAVCENRQGDKTLAAKKCKEAITIANGNFDNSASENNYRIMTRQTCATVLGKDLPAASKAEPKAITLQFKPIATSDIHDLAKRELEVKKFIAEDKKASAVVQMKRNLYLANIYTLEKKYLLAEPLFKKVIANVEKKYGKHSPQLLTPLSNYGFLLKQQGKQKEADAVLKRMQLMTGQRTK